MEIIHSYTRAQAIEDGVLFDVSKEAREAGIKYPVAISQGVYAILNDLRVPGQDFQGRLWDMLTIFKLAARQGGSRIDFSPLFATTESFNRRGPMPVKMYSICGPGDNMEPVITVMLPSED